METPDLDRTGTTQRVRQSGEKKRTIILILVLSFFFIGGIGTWGYYSLFGSKSAFDVDLPSQGEVHNAEKSSGTPIYKPTIEVPVTEIQKRLNEMHEYWNGKLGYDQWTNYKVSAHKTELNEVALDIRNDLLPYVTGPLKKDIENAVVKLESSLISNSVEPLKVVHRIFHDLDITLNGYKQATEFWEVTETYKWLQKEIK
jgi:hypothetical protein